MRYRFLDAMGDVVDEREFDDRTRALAWTGVDPADADASEDDEFEIHRVEYLGPEGDWRWAGTPGGEGQP